MDARKRLLQSSLVLLSNLLIILHADACGDECAAKTICVAGVSCPDEPHLQVACEFVGGPCCVTSFTCYGQGAPCDANHVKVTCLYASECP